MKSNENDKKNDIEASKQVTEIVERPQTDNNNKKNNTSASSQQQLLQLAKSYALEGAFLPPEKQMAIADRADKRERTQLMRQQKNLENIIIKAVAYCDNENAVNKADNDWFSRFIPLAEDISNVTMQGLWAKILAGEISRPGSFSLKSLKIFKDMSIYDAKLFGKACSLACHDNKRKNYRIITSSTQQPSIFNIFTTNRQTQINLNQHGLSYNDILTLADNHLVFLQESETSIFNKQTALNFDFNGIPLVITSKKAKCVIGFYKFTPIGTELARLINDAPDMDYLQSLKQQLGHHFTIQS